MRVWDGGCRAMARRGPVFGVLAIVILEACGARTSLDASPHEYRCRTDPGAVMVAVGTLHACAVQTGGALWCWGDNGAGEIGDGTTTTRVRPLPITALTNVAQVSAGGDDTCAIQGDGTLWCWGDNSAGELGNGTTTDAASPVRVTALTSVAQVSTAGDHVCAVLTDGTLWCWGHNMLGPLGDGTQTNNQPQLQPVGVTLRCP